MIANEVLFGGNAGRVWEALKHYGTMSMAKLCETAELEEGEAWGALGWLGREGKIKVDKSKKSFVFSLTE